jgi:hypothetical protein
VAGRCQNAASGVADALPGRLEPFYALHVWVWHHNPLGLFANWNPLVECGDGMAAGH